MKLLIWCIDMHAHGANQWSNNPSSTLYLINVKPIVRNRNLETIRYMGALYSLKLYRITLKYAERTHLGTAQTLIWGSAFAMLKENITFTQTCNTSRPYGKTNQHQAVTKQSVQKIIFDFWLNLSCIFLKEKRTENTQSQRLSENKTYESHCMKGQSQYRNHNIINLFNAN